MMNKLLLLPLSLWLFFTPLAHANPTSQNSEESDLFVHPINSEDRFEDYNRWMFEFNNNFIIISDPVARAYNDYTPVPIKKSFNNFFLNLREPVNAINNLLQGNIEKGLESILRFSFNSTFGFLGLIDVATPMGLQYSKEDMGQTLYKWGVWEESSFIILPIIGPYTTREILGAVGDGGINVAAGNFIDTDALESTGIAVAGKFVDYTKIIDLQVEMFQQPDPYIFMRESYLQYRTNQIFDGNPPVTELDDFDFE